MLDKLLGKKGPYYELRQLEKCYEKLIANGKQWIFRGQGKYDYGLQTTLERAIYSLKMERRKKNNLSIQRKVLNQQVGKRSVFELEGGLLRRFERQCHHFKIRVPDKDNIMEWLSLM